MGTGFHSEGKLVGTGFHSERNFVGTGFHSERRFVGTRPTDLSRCICAFMLYMRGSVRPSVAPSLRRMVRPSVACFWAAAL